VTRPHISNGHIIVQGVPVADTAAVFAAGVAAGVINAVAGGGTLLSFPVLVWAGRDPIIANATNALALWPGSLASALGLRRELRRASPVLALMLPPAVVGAALGGWLLLRTPSRVFSSLVPYLVLGATALMAAQHPLRRLTGGAAAASVESLPRPGAALALVLGQLLVSIYGGYFGAGMGILMLAALGIYGLGDIHQRNALKNATAAATNGVAGIYFAASGAIAWRDALILATGAIIGGYGGASLGRRMSRTAAEVLVVVVGVAMTIALFVRR
jgi:uncharacterized membrane protein YfcA